MDKKIFFLIILSLWTCDLFGMKRPDENTPLLESQKDISEQYDFELISEPPDEDIFACDFYEEEKKAEEDVGFQVIDGVRWVHDFEKYVAFLGESKNKAIAPKFLFMFDETIFDAEDFKEFVRILAADLKTRIGALEKGKILWVGYKSCENYEGGASFAISCDQEIIYLKEFLDARHKEWLAQNKNRRRVECLKECLCVVGGTGVMMVFVLGAYFVIK